MKQCRFVPFAVLAIVAGLQSSPRLASAQDYPGKPVKIIAAIPPGSANDVVARLLAQKLSERTGAQFYVENLPGAGGIIGTGTAARAPADGYTALIINQDYVIQPFMKSKVPYDPFKSFAPVSMAAVAPEVIVVHPSLPARDMKELMTLLKANPGKYSYASPGHGTSPHLASERLFKLSNGVDITHVPFQGGAPAVNSTVAGHTGVLHITLPLVAGHIRQGTLRALAVASEQRSPLFPDIPTLAEAGFAGHEVGFWTGFVVPSGTATSHIAYLNGQVVEALGLPDVKERLAAIGFSPAGSSPEMFARHIEAQSALWSTVIRDAKIATE